MVGSECITVDWLLDPSHDLSNPLRQASLHDQLQTVHFIAAALDCSTKSRAREIPRQFDDGRPAPSPLRSETYPEGLPHLSGRDAERVAKDNLACSFVLQEIHDLASRGGASVRENPWRSLHWFTQQERDMWDSGLWRDKRYSACVFAGVRSKSQCLRHNLDEIDDWPVMDCHHSHDPEEWAPSVVDGVRVFPSKEEAEYTAPLAFSVAVAASWWAARTGLAKLHVPRMPAIQTTGRREHWLQMDPRCMREWAMAPLAISLGLSPLDPGEASRVPARARVEEVLQPDGKIPPNHVYVGRGHHSHRLPLSAWTSPFTPGHDCSEDAWLCLCVNHICSTLWDQLPSLHGQTLVCDCPWQSLCEADLLAGLVFDALAPNRPPFVAQAGNVATRPHRARSVYLATMFAEGATGATIPPVVPVRWSQESVVLAFRKLFPAPWFEGFSFPMVEDLLNQSPLTDFPAWLSSQGLDWDTPLGPAAFQGASRLRQRHADRQQAGAHSGRAALPPLLSFGLDPDEHFSRTWYRSQQPLPTEGLPLLDLDLQFAASLHATHRGHLRTLRNRAIGALRELKRRWAGVSRVLRHHQPDPIRRVTEQRDLGLVSLLVVMTSWADTGYPFGLIQGLPAVGFAPPYGIFPELVVEPITFEEVLGDWRTHNSAMLRQLHPGKDDHFLLQQSITDAEQSFCSFPMKRAEFLRFICDAPHRLIPRCVITQSSGKQRVIDNADVGGQTASTRESNKLVLCSPFRPAQQIALTLSMMSATDLSAARVSDTWQSGGEDWPNAYRHSPIRCTPRRPWAA